MTGDFADAAFSALSLSVSLDILLPKSSANTPPHDGKAEADQEWGIPIFSLAVRSRSLDTIEWICRKRFIRILNIADYSKTNS